jgi:exopolyphosphatase / guanosine-5'-triphosphate,3'-diphosphate pyrophosphatase
MPNEPKSPRRFAAIDLGSMTVRLAVAEFSAPGQFRKLLHLREITSLGQGLAQTGLLAPEAMDRTLAALKGFVREMQAQEVEVSRAVGTQALRQARNRQEFLDAVRQALGLAVQVISPEEEARLSLQGVLSALAPHFKQASALLVVDVGGGSTEWALVGAGRSPNFASLPLGVLTLSQSQPLGDPPRPELVAALREKLRSQLTGFYERKFGRTARPVLVGTAGSITTLAALNLKLAPYDPDRINNTVLTRSQVADLAENLCRLPEAERARLPGIEPAKAGVMVAGALLVLTIMEVCRQDLLVVVDAGLLEGVLRQISLEF